MKKRWNRFLAVGLSVAMLFTSTMGNHVLASETDVEVVHAVYEEIFSGHGKGTKENPYYIENAQQLDEIRYDMSAYYILANDIDLSSVSNWNTIGDEENPFSGTLNGNGYTIENLHIDCEDKNYVGLFGYCPDAAFHNINLTNISITLDKQAYDYTDSWGGTVYVGAIAAGAENISNCTVDGNIFVLNCSNAYVGGIVGMGRNPNNCTNSADIYVLSNKNGRYENDGTVYCGGIVGFPGAVYGKVINCKNYGKIEAVSGDFLYCGGICGEDGSIRRCVNYGDVSGETRSANSYSSFAGNCNVGGITGATSGEILYSVNYGNVNSYAQKGASSYAGGIAGWNGYYSSGVITNCINAGNLIKSIRQTKSDDLYTDIDSNAGRIAAISYKTEGCSSLETTTCNGVIPTEEIGADTINGISLDADSLEKAILNICANEDNVIAKFPNNGELDVDPIYNGVGYDIIICFDGKVTSGDGDIRIVNLDTGSVQYYDVSYSDYIKLEESVLTVPNVQLDYDTNYSIQFDDGCIYVDGKAFFGFSSDNDWIFRTKEEEVDYFKLKEDTNQFYHYGLPYTINNSTYKSKLYRDSLMTWDGTFQLYKYLDEATSGVCHGIALSMCYGNQGSLDFNNIKSGASNYWQLGDPRSNSSFSDMIVYYHLTQLTAKGTASKTLDRGGWHITSLENRMQSFLQSFVNEAKESQNKKMPFVFSFGEGNGEGHSVVVCGYSWNKEKNCHEIKIYDENSYEESGTFGYCTMSVPSDYSSFEFADANAQSGGYTIQDIWTSLSYMSIDKIYNDIAMLQLEPANSLLAMSSSAQTTIQITKEKKFYLENAQGEWLKYDGQNYTGTMTVYDCYSGGLEDSPIWNITVNSSESFKLSQMDTDCEIICNINGQGYAASANGANSVKITAEEIKVTGKSYTLEAAVQTAENDMVQISADAIGNSTVHYDVLQDTVKANSEGKFDNTAVRICGNGDSNETQIANSVKKVTVDSEKVEVTKSEDEQTDDNTARKTIKLTFAESSVTKTYGASDFKNKLTITNNGKVIYQSSNKKVAIVDSQGKVTIKGVGTAKITAKPASGFIGNAVSYILNVNPKGTSISGKIVAKSKGFVVKWKKQKKQITGYQIQYSTSKKFTKKTTVTKMIPKSSTVKYTAKKLKNKKKYYVRIRTYKTVSGKKYYSGWSKIKNVTTKKK